MQLLIHTGTNSMGQLQSHDLQSMPHLFVSYAYEQHLQLFLHHLFTSINQWQQNSPLTVALALNRRNSYLHQQLHNPASISMVYSEAEQAQTLNTTAFIRGLMKLLRKREQAAAKAALQQTVIAYEPVVIVIDELFQMVTTKRKPTAIAFLECVVKAHLYNMHFVACSVSSYRNLMIKIIHLDDSIERMLHQYQLKSPFKHQIIKPLGDEMIITPDGLSFYKKINTHELEKYYPLPPILQ